VVGGAHGSGRVYEKGRHVGDAVMNQVTVGAQLGGQAYREIVFFQDKRAFDEFTSGQFELGAQATAVAITAGASAQASTGGTSAGASSAAAAGHASTKGGYQGGMAVFTVARGGLMYEASVGGQKFGYRPK
jgi:lipid-binding SYLF domain-containing protein